MDLVQLRALLFNDMERLKEHCSHTTLTQLCAEIGLPDAASVGGSKRDRLWASLKATTDAALPMIAERILALHPPRTKLRNTIQDVMWTDAGYPVIPKKYRHQVARALNSENHFLNVGGFDSLIERLFVLRDEELELLAGPQNDSLAARIQQHVYRNLDDWSAEQLFEELGAFEATDRRFALFLEGLASANVRPDEVEQRRVVTKINGALSGSGVELRETEGVDGYPTFTIVLTRASSPGRVKNLIFASSVKPDLRFKDAVNNDIEIVTQADKVLVYDEPIPADGLRWRRIQSWWSQLNGIPDDEQAKRSLYARLRECLPANSPPQHTLFDAYHRGFGAAIPDMPALLPEVWLHWDPKTVTERGRDALFRFRMDFLMLLPSGVRIVLEVDGLHHYARADGRADPRAYAATAAADRELKLAGYEVFRFGAAELQREDAPQLVKAFFVSMFRSFGVPIPS